LFIFKRKNSPRVTESFDYFFVKKSVITGLHSCYIYLLANRAPALPRKNLMSLRNPSRTLFVKQSFFSSDLFRFWSLGYPRVQGSAWQGHCCNFPVFLWRSEQNLLEIGLAVRTWKGDVGTNSLTYIDVSVASVCPFVQL